MPIQKMINIRNSITRKEKRLKIEIVRDILNGTLERKKKSKLVLKVNLNLHSINYYLDSLLKTGHLVINKVKDKRKQRDYYLLTEKGSMLLAELNTLINRLRFLERGIFDEKRSKKNK